VVDTAYWHINADEPRVLDYNEEYKPGCVHSPARVYSPHAYRSSDHDPILVHLRPRPRIFLPVVMRGDLP
jgi:predicted extracellular nuclease